MFQYQLFYYSSPEACHHLSTNIFPVIFSYCSAAGRTCSVGTNTNRIDSNSKNWEILPNSKPFVHLSMSDIDHCLGIDWLLITTLIQGMNYESEN